MILGHLVPTVGQVASVASYLTNTNVFVVPVHGRLCSIGLTQIMALWIRILYLLGYPGLTVLLGPVSPVEPAGVGHRGGGIYAADQFREQCGCLPESLFG